MVVVYVPAAVPETEGVPVYVPFIPVIVTVLAVPSYVYVAEFSVPDNVAVLIT
jgi:hypothetical protein